MIANSKCWQLDFFNKCGVAHLGNSIVEKNQEFQSEGKSLFREEYSFQEWDKRLLKELIHPSVKGVVSKFVNVENEFGVTVNRNKTFNISINSSEKSGRFKGSKYYLDFNRQKQEFENIGDFNFFFLGKLVNLLNSFSKLFQKQTQHRSMELFQMEKFISLKLIIEKP